MKPLCVKCYEPFSAKRRNLGYTMCMPCGDGEARKRKFTVAPMHKSNYMMFTDMNDLKGINNKGGLIK